MPTHSKGEQVFSLNHIVIGTRRSGSYVLMNDETEEDFISPEISTWMNNANVGDNYETCSSVYWTRVQ